MGLAISLVSSVPEKVRKPSLWVKDLGQCRRFGTTASGARVEGATVGTPTWWSKKAAASGTTNRRFALRRWFEF